jgi:hypothetical protein
MVATLDHRFLRTAPPKDIALRLRKLALANLDSLDAISEQLLEAIASESVPPMVFALWTSACPNDSATVAGMQCSHSIVVRSSAIRNFRRRLRTAKCENIWRALGGTHGVVNLLANFSVIHVKEFCKAVARCSTSKQATAERQHLVTKLLEALTSTSDDPVSGTRNLLDQYSKLVYTCTPDFKRNWISQRGTSDLDMVKVFELDIRHYQQQCLRAVVGSHGTLGPGFEMYLPLFRSVPQKPHAPDISISESMAFSVQTLNTAQQVGLLLKPAAWLDETICSLLSRVVRRKLSYESARDVLTSVASCVQRQSDDVPLKQNASAQDKQYCRKIVQLWQRAPQTYEPILTPLLRAHHVRLYLERSTYSGRDDKSSIQHFVETTKRDLRYRLLRWILLNHPEYRVDIEDNRHLKDNLKVSLSDKLLSSLPSADALRLLERYNTHSTKPMALRIRALTELEHEPRIELLRLYLMDDTDAVLRVARDRANHSKQMAQDSGSQPVRSVWIRASIYFSVASQSLDLLKEIILWTRRFSRDPKTVIELYGAYPDGGQAFADEKTVALLSGMPRKLQTGVTIVDVAKNVHKGNEVMLDLLQSALQTQSDPSFKPWHWQKVKHLFKRVVLIRLERMNSLQVQLKLTDEQMFNAVWKDTVDTLVKAETLGLAPDNSNLELNDMNGLMGFAVYSSGTRADKMVYTLSKASLRFMDELAVLRESLWRLHRVAELPAVTTLPRPWPRGLPIQAHWFLGKDQWRILPGKDDTNQSSGALPFLGKKAGEVVLLPSRQALSPVPSDDEVKSAVGQFIDDYRLALKLYLEFGAPSGAQEKRAQAAWTHATHYLSGDRMSVSERQTYWRQLFLDAGMSPESPMLSSDAYPELELPAPDFYMADLAEWHPGPGTNITVPKVRKLDPLAIDCMVQPLPPHWARSPRLLHDQFEVKPRSAPGFWNLKRYDKKGMHLSQETREAYVAAALLLADGRSQAGSKIFNTPFPSMIKPRFPAIYLDAELLDSKVPTDEDVAKILKRFLPVVPSSLLKTLAERLVEKALKDTTSSNVLRRWTTVVLGSLVMSDRPYLATNLIVQIVLGSPSETHWHRILLHPGILKRLPPFHARLLMQELAEGILDRLPRQADVSAPIESSGQTAVTPGPFSPSNSAVKVTTAKMLARVLKDATFLGDDFVVNTLISLFQKATHVHVRAAAVNGLAAVLYSSRSDRASKAIINALATHVVPVAAELNERSPMVEALWALAEEQCQPPQVYVDPGLAPICRALVEVVRSAPKDFAQSQNLVEKILLPLIQQSRDNNNRWTSIFLRKYDASDLAPGLPKVPARSELLQILLEDFCSCMPLSEFEALSNYTLQTNYPPQRIMDLAEELKRDPQIYKRNEVRHWRHLTAPLAPNSIHGTSHGIIRTLQHGKFATAEQAAAQDLVLPEHLQTHEYDMLDCVFSDYSSNMDAWDHYLEHFNPPLQDDEHVEPRCRWREYCRPIIQRAISLVDTARTSAWRQDPQRQQLLLPDIFNLRLQLLTYPSLYPSSQQEECLDSLADDVLTIIEQLPTSRRPYHAQWSLLMTALKQCAQRHWMPLALRLGKLQDRDVSSEELTLAELLCVDAADELLTALGKKTSGKRLQAAKAMMKGWMESCDEEVRRKGVNLIASL